MKGLRDRVADGVDPAKLYEPQVQEQETNQQGISLLVSILIKYSCFLIMNYFQL